MQVMSILRVLSKFVGGGGGNCLLQGGGKAATRGAGRGNAEALECAQIATAILILTYY